MGGRPPQTGYRLRAPGRPPWAQVGPLRRAEAQMGPFWAVLGPMLAEMGPLRAAASSARQILLSRGGDDPCLGSLVEAGTARHRHSPFPPLFLPFSPFSLP